MSSKKTPNLGLHEWVPDDYVQMEEFNENFRKLDQKTGELVNISQEVEGQIVQVTEHLAHITLNITNFGASLDGKTPVDNALYDALEVIRNNGGGKITFPFNSAGYVLNNVTTDVSNVEIDFNNNVMKQNSGTGYQLRFEGSLSMQNIKIKNWYGKGDNTKLANAGLGFALDSANSHIDGLTLENCIAEEFAQYGINIGSASNQDIRNTKILNHGSIADGATIGIGFVIYPRSLESGCVIENLYSRINPNSKLTSAAIKLQVISDLKAYNIHGVNGTESCMSLDATNNSVYEEIFIESEYTIAHLGVALSSNNAEVGIVDSFFIIKDIKAKGLFTSALTFAADGAKKIKIQDAQLKGYRLSASSNSVVENCEVSGSEFQDVRLDIFTGAVANNNDFNNVKISYGGAFTLTGDGNRLNKVTGINAGTIKTKGNNNLLIDCESKGSSASSFTLEGNNNLIIGGLSDNPATRHVSIMYGDGNKILSLNTIGTQLIENLGTNSIIRQQDLSKSQKYGPILPTTGTNKKGDIVWNSNPSIGQPIGWVCTLDGTPGDWKPFGQNGVYTTVSNTPNFLGQFAVVNGVGYIATGTTSSADWKQITN